MTVWSIRGAARVAVAAAVAVVVLAACGDDGGYESPIVNEEAPVMDIASLPDIEQTRNQMVALLERMRAEITRLVPRSPAWIGGDEEMRGNCTYNGSVEPGTRLYLAMWTTSISLTDAEWDLVFPAVQRLAAEAGLTEVEAKVDATYNHDVEIRSNDGRTLRIGSKEATLLTGQIDCRRSAAGNAP